MASRRTRSAEKTSTAGLSGKERGAIDEFLAYIEFRLRDAEPASARLVRLARLALVDPDKVQDLGGALH